MDTFLINDTASRAVPLTGTEAQVEWANRIRIQVNVEFDRVAMAFRAVALTQTGDKRAETEAIIGILEDQRTLVMNNGQAGYFIHDWQELSDQVRQLIFHDARYQAIKTARPARRT